MSTDLRAAILARCDELKRLARAALHEAQDCSGRWTARGERLVEVDGDHEWYVADVPGRRASHMAAWDPAAVLEVVAGAREMCEVHTPSEFPARDHSAGSTFQWAAVAICATCHDETQTASLPDFVVPWPCPSLRATARMLGVEVPADA